MAPKTKRRFRPVKMKLKVHLESTGRRSLVLPAVVVAPFMAIHKHIHKDKPSDQGFSLTHTKTGLSLWSGPLTKMQAVTFARYLDRLEGLDLSKKHRPSQVGFLHKFMDEVKGVIASGWHDIDVLHESYKLTELDKARIRGDTD